MSGIVHSALDGHLASIPDLPPVAWENALFEQPKDGSTYIRVAFMPATADMASLGTQGTIHERGIYQVGISAPVGMGSGEAEDLADRIMAHFRNKTIGTVRALVPRRAQAMPDGSRLWLPVSIPYLVETFF